MSQQYDDDTTYTEDPDEEGYDYTDDPNVRAVDPEPEPAPVPEPRRRETVIPIGEAVTPETLHGVVAFTRSVNLGSRDNNAHFRCELPFVVQPQWKPDQVAAQAADTFYQCVAVVLQQAGLPFTLGEDGVIHEVVKAFPGTSRREEPDRREELGPYGRRQPEGQRRMRDEPEDDRRGGGGGFPHPADMERPEHVNAGLWRDLCENYDDWYDNRDEKARGEGYPNGPDFKRKDDGKGLWMVAFRREGGGGGRGGGHARSGGGQRRYRD